MKKILSLGVASAICALTAISASAAPAAYANQKGDLTNGSVVTFDVLAGEDLTGLNFNIEVSGLELQSCEYPKTASLGGHLQSADGVNKWYVSNGTAVVAKAGEVLCTVTAKVTAKPGDTVSVSFVSEKYAAVLPEKAWTAVVKGAEENPSSGTTSGESTTSGDSKPADPSKPAEGESKPAGEEKPGNPGTGVALAVVPAVLAAAGVIVAKKRK